MKKEFKFLCMLLMATIIFSAGCKKDDDTLPAINVGFKYTPENPIAGEAVTFTNASNGGSTYMWDLGDGNTSTEQNPVHTFEISGTYTVTLKVDDREDAFATKTVTVQDQVPEITASLEQIQIGVDVTFTGAIYNPDGSTVTYTWQFPVGKVIGEGVDASTGVATGETITVKFLEAEESTGHTIKLTTTIGTNDYMLTKNFVVKNQLAKTVYFAEKGGNMWMKKIYANGEAELVDMGIASGAHPLNLQIANERLYVFDGGEIIKYSTAVETTVGSIFSMGLDGTTYKTHITFTDNAYDDAFSGCVVADEGDGTGNLYWHNRNAGMHRIDIASENIVFDAGTMAAYAGNADIGYYHADATTGIDYWGWGVINGGLKKIDGVYWMSKLYNGHGIFKFEDTDIGVTANHPTAGAILVGYSIRYFAIDEVNSKVYFSVVASNGDANDIGLYVADLDGSNPKLIDGSLPEFEAGGNEEVFITGIDIDNESGYVYWAYRGPELDGSGNPIDYEANPLYKSGIKRYKLDGSGEVEYFVEDILAYGLAIDHTKR